MAVNGKSATVCYDFQPGKDIGMAWVTLQSNDLERFVIEAEVAKKSILIKNLLEDLPEDEEPIPIPVVNAAILKKVIVWMEHHKVHSINKV